MTKTASPPHAYLSAIRDLTEADGEENLRKKREQQAAFAESLKSQIEDKAKRKAKATAQSRFTFSDKDRPPPGTGLTSALRVGPDPPAPRPKASRRQILSKADLTQFDIFAKNGTNGYVHRAIPISTDSPFVNSKIPTPPQGFSLRTISALEPTVPRFQTVEGKQGLAANAKNIYGPRSKSILKYSDVLGPSKLGVESELIYPDGHSSPLSSTRHP
jgi:hypothetical protein